MTRLPSFALFAALALAGVAAEAAQWPALDSAPAEVAKTGEDDIALLVGIEDYLLLPDVPGATRNVRDWEVFLREGLGVSTIVTLSNTEAVREEILAAAERVRERASEGATVWVVFVGHGAPSPDGTDGLLVGADGQQTVNSLATRSVSQRELMALFAGGPQARTMMIVDACFSGRDSSGEALAKGVQPVVPVDITEVPDGVTLMTAARSTEFAGALPGEDRPAFSYLLLGAVRGWAAEGDDEVTAGEAVQFARNELADVVGRDQTPQIIGNTEAVLSMGVSEAAPRKAAPAVAAAEPVGSDSGEVTTVRWGSGGPVPLRGQSGDPITDDLGYLKFHVGLGGIDSFSSLGGFLNVSPGVKLVRGRRADFRLGAWLGMTTYRNPDAPEIGDPYNDPYSSGTSDIAVVNDTTETFAHLGAGPGFAFRLGHVGAGFDHVLYIDTAAGLSTSVGGYCTSYKIDFFAECEETDSRLGPMLGARVGAEFPVLDIAGYAKYRAAFGDVTFGITAGLSFDR